MAKGCEQPRIFTPPLRELTPDTTLGFECIAFAEDVLGIRLIPWQRWLLIHALEIIDEPDGTTTTVDAATFNTGSFSSRSQDDSWYSLTGARLTEVPTQKGVYIHQGRKVVIR